MKVCSVQERMRISAATQNKAGTACLELTLSLTGVWEFRGLAEQEMGVGGLGLLPRLGSSPLLTPRDPGEIQALTIVFGELHQEGDLGSAPKLLRVSHQGVLDRLVPTEHHHGLQPQPHGEDGAVGAAELWDRQLCQPRSHTSSFIHFKPGLEPAALLNAQQGWEVPPSKL